VHGYNAALFPKCLPVNPGGEFEGEGGVWEEDGDEVFE